MQCMRGFATCSLDWRLDVPRVIVTANNTQTHSGATSVFVYILVERDKQ